MATGYFYESVAFLWSSLIADITIETDYTAGEVGVFRIKPFTGVIVFHKTLSVDVELKVSDLHQVARDKPYGS
jgi:hypothetical protein